MAIIDNLFSELSDNSFISDQIISMHIRNVLKKNDLKLTKVQVNSVVEALLSKSELTGIDLSLSKKQVKSSIYKDASEASKGIENDLEEYLNNLSEDCTEKDFEIIKNKYIQKYLGEIETTKQSLIKKN